MGKAQLMISKVLGNNWILTWLQLIWSFSLFINDFLSQSIRWRLFSEVLSLCDSGRCKTLEPHVIFCSVLFILFSNINPIYTIYTVSAIFTYKFHHEKAPLPFLHLPRCHPSAPTFIAEVLQSHSSVKSHGVLQGKGPGFNPWLERTLPPPETQ